MEDNLKVALEGVKNDLEAKNANELKSLKDELTVAMKEVKESNGNEFVEVKEALKAVQSHIDSLDVKLQEKAVKDAKTGDDLKDIIRDNYDQIKEAPNKRINIKAVANMTLSSALTGDQPRDYSMEVAAVPGQLLNVADLIGSIPISGGTYTFPRESGGEGTIGTQTEGSDKAQVDFDLTMVDVNTDFIAGFCVYSKKMANNLPFLESFLPNALRRDYWIAENTAFDAVLAAGVTASSQVITSKNKVEMLINEVATLEAANFQPNAIVMQPSDFYDILKTEKSTGAGYGLPPYVSYENGQMRINGMPVYKANWVDANKYYVGDWSRIKKVVTEGLSIAFSEHDEDNFRKNNISARVEAQVGLAIERTDAIIYGDFTAT